MHFLLSWRIVPIRHVRATSVEVTHPPEVADIQCPLGEVLGCDQDLDISAQLSTAPELPVWSAELSLGCIKAFLPILLASLPVHGLILGIPWVNSLHIQLHLRVCFLGTNHQLRVLIL